MTICNELIPGILRGRRNDTINLAKERFFRRVRTNLHVIVCSEYPSNDTAKEFPSLWFSRYPTLLTKASCIDVYQPWQGSSLTKASLLRLSCQNFNPQLQEMINPCKNSVAEVMSHVHTSSVENLEQQFGFNQYKCHTPKTFLEFVDVFANCCEFIWKQEQVNTMGTIRLQTKFYHMKSTSQCTCESHCFLRLCQFQIMGTFCKGLGSYFLV